MQRPPSAHLSKLPGFCSPAPAVWARNSAIGVQSGGPELYTELQENWISRPDRSTLLFRSGFAMPNRLSRIAQVAARRMQLYDLTRLRGLSWFIRAEICCSITTARQKPVRRAAINIAKRRPLRSLPCWKMAELELFQRFPVGRLCPWTVLFFVVSRDSRFSELAKSQ